MEESNTLIKETTLELLQKMGFPSEVEVRPIEGGFRVEIISTEPEFLIGSRGNNLSSLQRVLKMVIRAKLQKPFILDLDINGYRERHVAFLRQIARSLAERVYTSHESLTMKPMPSYDRRIIHLELSSYDGLTTESVGEEPERRLIIKPVLRPSSFDQISLDSL